MHLFGYSSEHKSPTKQPLTSQDLERGYTKLVPDVAPKMNRPILYNQQNSDKATLTARWGSWLAALLLTFICLSLILLITFIAVYHSNEPDFESALYSEVHEDKGSIFASQANCMGGNCLKRKVAHKQSAGVQWDDGGNGAVRLGRLLDEDTLGLEGEDLNGFDNVDGDEETDNEDGDQDDDTVFLYESFVGRMEMEVPQMSKNQTARQLE